MSGNQTYQLALRSSKTSRLFAMLDWPPWHTITSTSGEQINTIAETCSSLSFLSFLLAPIFAAIYSTAYTVYLTHNNGTHKPADDALIQYLKETFMFSNDCPIYIIMDALDECPDTFRLPSPSELALDLVKELVELSLPHLHICVTSRPENDIRIPSIDISSSVAS
ncbi:hypothetical protein EDB83DRAFT_327802 [Lactarius deliciosus]|nr:hypothetical protein EDB83DRAFT_327802 [Lactarius deliciosus]